jgi:hypothetical protein
VVQKNHWDGGGLARKLLRPLAKMLKKGTGPKLKDEEKHDGDGKN